MPRLRGPKQYSQKETPLSCVLLSKRCKASVISRREISKGPSSLSQTMLDYNRRCMIFWRVLKVCFGVILKYARCLSGPNFLLFSSGLRKHIDILTREKATLKQ